MMKKLLFTFAILLALLLALQPCFAVSYVRINGFYIAGLPPQKVADSNSERATGDVHQSKIVYNNGKFFVLFLESVPNHLIKYSASINGIEWTSPTILYDLTGNYVISPWAGNIDIRIKNNTSLHAILTYTEVSPIYGRPTPRRLDISDTTLTSKTLWFTTFVGNKITTSKLNLALNGKLYGLVHGSQITYSVYVPDPWAVGTRVEYTNVPAFSEDTGGIQLLNYKTSGDYDMLALVKQGSDDILFYGVFHGDTETLDTPMTSLNVTLASGFNSFSATTEAVSVNAAEKVHLVYIKSTGELCYRKFENDVWNSEEVLVVSGASYPVIAVGSGGELYVFCVKDEKIWLLLNSGIWHDPIELFTGEHDYNNPTYLSTSQNAQNGKICLVWTEGTSSPYSVYFSYVNDGEYYQSLTVNTDPSGLGFSLNGTSFTAPQSLFFLNGTECVLEVSNQSRGFLRVDYYFEKWENDDTNSTRVITLTEDTSVTALFTYTDPRSGYYTILPIIGAGLGIGMMFLVFAVAAKVRSGGEIPIQLIIMPLIFVFALILIYIYLTVMAGL